MTEIVTIPLSRIVADPQFQPRGGGLSASHLQLLMESDPATWPPLTVSPNDQKTFYLIDGFHRFEVAKRRKLEALPSIVQEGSGYPEAVFANVSHGLPLSRTDRKDAARWWKERDPTLSFREIGRRCGLSDKTAAAAIREGERSAKPRPEPDPVARFVSQIVRADDDGYATVRAMRREIECYDEASRPDIANALATIGTVIVDAAAPYLKRR